MEPPNIILIILDTLRADKLLSTHKGNQLTPFIRELLKNSLYFENCIANSPWTVPSHINMFTGLYSTQMKNLSNRVDKLHNKIPVITEILSNLGYFTICFTENPHINKKEGFTRGFKVVIDCWQNLLIHPKRFWKDRIEKILPISKSTSRINSYIKKRISSADIILFKIKKLLKNFKNRLFWKKILIKKTTTLDQLERVKEALKNNIDAKPFYLYFNIMATHYPYVSPRKILNKFNISDKEIKIIRNFLLTNPKNLINLTKSKPLSSKKITIINKLYNASVFYADLITKEIFSILDTFGLLENSYVIITSDHGEHLCNESDHYLCDHTTYISLYESLLKVPLVIYHKNFEYQIIKNQVELKDIYHTLISLTNEKVSSIKSYKENKSILYQVKNNSMPKFIIGEYLKQKLSIYKLINRYRGILKKDVIPQIVNDLYSVRSDNYKYINYNSSEELFNLKKDINELFNVKDTSLEELKLIKNSYYSFKKQMSEEGELTQIITEKEKDLIKKSIKFSNF